MERVLPFGGKIPELGDGVFIARGAQIIGDVTLGDQASVWFNAVLRGDVMPITIGPRTNIQDLSVVHVTSHTHPTHIGADVTVGHRAILHGCTVEDACLIGMGATLLDGAHIEPGCLIAAGALIPPGMRVPAHSLVMGAPGKIRREVTPEERQRFLDSAAHYVELASSYRVT